MTNIIDGKLMAEKIKDEIKHKVAVFRDTRGIQPCLAVILVGEDPASLTYIKHKEKACNDCGIKLIKYELSDKISENELLNLIREKNADRNVHGILVQLPLPAHIDVNKVISTINPQKDVDGFHPMNVGKLSIGDLEGTEAGIISCTAKGCMKLIKSALGSNIAGQKAIVIGRSNIVGKPVSYLLLRENCTVKIAHSKTEDLKNECLWADIIVVAVGLPNLITADMVKSGATVIDVGMNRANGQLCGDVDFENVKEVAEFITPVPNGVGPMTIACLLENILEVYDRLTKIK